MVKKGQFSRFGEYLDKEYTELGCVKLTYFKYGFINPRGKVEYNYKLQSLIRKACHKYQWYIQLRIKDRGDCNGNGNELSIYILKPPHEHSIGDTMKYYDEVYNGVNARYTLGKSTNLVITSTETGEWYVEKYREGSPKRNNK